MTNKTPTIFSLDLPSPAAYYEGIMSAWEFNIFSIKKKYFLVLNADEMLDYFVNYAQMKYRGYYGDNHVIYNDEFLIYLDKETQYEVSSSASSSAPHLTEEVTIYFYGKREVVRKAIDDFEEWGADNIKPPHFNVDWIYQGSHGPTYASIPLKHYKSFHPEMYPFIKDVDSFVDDFINSSSNVLILMGEPGLGKSALINYLLHRAKKNTQVVYDKEIMTVDSIYADFIQKANRNGGGIFVIEDADEILKSREEGNATMAKLLNISDGILDNSFAKFIFSTNITDKNNIDDALIRPGRCYDVIKFRSLTKDEAVIAATAIGKNMDFSDKESFSVAEIYNQKNNIQSIKQKIGF